MSPNLNTFGRNVNHFNTINDFARLEIEKGNIDEFRKLDELVGELVVRSLRREKIATITQSNLRVNTVKIYGLDNENQIFLDNTFGFENQQRRGAWFLPDSEILSVGIINLPWAFHKHSRFASGVVLEERGKVFLASSADAVCIWTILEPFFEELFLPFKLRGSLAGTIPRDEINKIWNKIDAFYELLGFHLNRELSVFRFGGGWHQMRADAQLEAKNNLLEALAQQVRPEIATYYRLNRVQKLISNYYKKSNYDGKARRIKVLTKAFIPTLSGFFGGDWLAFLNYLGEQPHPEEEIVTALPATRPFVSGANCATTVAATLGVSTEEVERIAAAYWQQPSRQSPVEQRVCLLERYWSVFDQIHANQAVGMKPLWGLVEDCRVLDFNEHNRSPYQHQLYLTLLPEDLKKEIDNLWGTVMLVKFPDIIVSELFPHALMADTFGAALKFWHGCALTAWFLCEGPSSRTDMAGLAHYYRHEIATLNSLRTPINPEFFAELINAESQLGPPETIYNESQDFRSGSTLEFQVGYGNRREGFEKLRDIITRYRRIWSESFLKTYLQVRWEIEITEAGNNYHLLLNNHGGKFPRIKDFSKLALTATNHWFGGNISSLYGAIREKSPVQPSKNLLMPTNKFEFAKAVYESLPYYFPKSHLANLSLLYIQMEEAIGKKPESKDLKFQKLFYSLDTLWTIHSGIFKSIGKYKKSNVSEAIEDALNSRFPTSLKEKLVQIGIQYIHLEREIGREPKPNELGYQEVIENYLDTVFIFYSPENLNKAWSVYTDVIESVRYNI